MLVKYVRDACGKMVGTVVAIDRDAVGWSQCNAKDNFNKEKGKKIAVGRALVCHSLKTKPVKNLMFVDEGNDNYSLVKADLISVEVEVMKERSRRYFKLAS